MASLRTRITRLLNITTPVVAPPMAGASGGSLAAEVTRAGSFGFLSAGTPATKRELDIARAAIGAGVREPLNIGVGYLAWQLEQKSANPAELLALTLEQRVKAVWFSCGNDLGRWVDFVRRYDQARTEAHKTIIFILVNSVEEAKIAIDEWEADVLVAQGIESGGHGSGSALPVLNLVPEILHAFPRGPPVLAAGGLATGAHVASLLTLGASGAVLGTRFLASNESLYNSAQKAALVAAKGSSTVRTLVFDELRESTLWPSGIDARGLWNHTLKDVESGVGMDIVKQKFDEAVRTGDANRMITWSGTGVGLMNEIKDAGDLVRGLHDETVEHLRAAQAILS